MGTGDGSTSINHPRSRFRGTDMLKRFAGLVFITGALAVALGGETKVFAKLHVEKSIFATGAAAETGAPLGEHGSMPDLANLVRSENTAWLNSAPLSSESLRGKVVLVDFWTYSCINSLRNISYVQSWAAKYRDAGLVVVGVHTPEFGFEKDPANVAQALRDLNVTYPVANDSSYAIWQAFGNEYWPADYVVDGKGRIRYQHFGEGDYGESERVIQQLLRENGAGGIATGTVRDDAKGIEAPSSDGIQSPETYVGFRQTERFASPERMVRDVRKTYSLPVRLALNQWGLGGSWTVGAEAGILQDAPGRIVFRFHSRDLHLVLGPTTSGRPVHFHVTLDGRPPGTDHGADTAADGAGEVREPRLYQLIRQQGDVSDRTFEIEFVDPGVQAFAFTFG